MLFVSPQRMTSANRDVANNALQAAMGLTGVDRCKDLVALTAVEPEPTDAAAAIEIASIRRELATAKANLDTVRSGAAREEIEPLVARAHKVAYAPLLAEVLLASARAKATSGVSRDVSIDEGTQAVVAADAGRADGTRAEAATWLIRWTTDAGRYDEAERWSRVAEAALRRAGDEGSRKAEWLAALAWLHDAKGRAKESAAYFRDALDTSRRAGSDVRTIAGLERDLAQEEAGLGKGEDAERLLDDADASIVASMGEEHPARIPFLHARSYVAALVNDNRGALGWEKRAIELAERVQPDNSMLSHSYNNACSELHSLGDDAGALAYCEKAIASGLRVQGPESSHMGYAYTNMGDVLSGLRRYEEGIEYFTRAIRVNEKNGAEHETNFVHALLGVGRARMLIGKPREALLPLERALRASATAEAESPEWQAGRRRRRALHSGEGAVGDESARATCRRARA